MKTSNNTSKKLFGGLFGFLLILAIPCTPAGAQDIVYLGNLGAGGSEATAVNQSGQVVGEGTVPGTQQDPSIQDNAFLYSNGTMSNLGTLLSTDNNSEATGINSTGQVVGNSGQVIGLNAVVSSNAFIYSGGTLTNIGNLGNGPTFADGINDSGQVVGESRNSSGYQNAYVYTTGTGIQNLNTIDSSLLVPLYGAQNGFVNFYDATAINNSGQIVTEGQYMNGTQYENLAAIINANGTMTNLGTLGGFATNALNINSTGEVVGSSVTGTGKTVAFLYANGTMVDLGAGNYSSANGINDLGQVVGNYLVDSGSPQAFFYSATTGLKNLNTLFSDLLVSGTGSQAGFTKLVLATGITNSGDIIGDGDYYSGINGSVSFLSAFILNTDGTLESISSTPEPSTWALMLGGLGLLALCVRRKAAQLK